MKQTITKHEKVYVKIAFIITIIAIVLIGYGLSFIPDKLDEEFISSVYMRPISDFVAEKSEMIQYIVLMIAFPILFIVFNQIINKIKPKINETDENIIDALGIISVIVLTIIILAKSSFYIEKSILSSCFILFAFMLLFIIIGINLYEKLSKKRTIRLVNIIIYIVIGFILAVIGYLYINNSYAQTPYVAHHVDAYFYPVYKILSGLTPGVDFDSIYGYYSYFFSAIMQILGQKDIYSFSFIIAGLVIIAIGNLSIFTGRVIKNKVVALITILSFVFTLVIQHFLATGGYYLQYIPHRILFPSMMLIYILIYLKYRNGKHKKILQLGGFLIATLATLWNLETGVIVLGVWICFLGYEVLFFHSLKESKTYKEIGKIILMTTLTICLYFIILNIVAFARTGKIVGIADIIYGQATFLGSGFCMLKMPLCHPWVLLVLVYAIALVISIKKLKFMNNNTECDKYNENSIIFALAILGMGIFSYYQGRSHDYVFIYIVYPAIILLGVYLDYFIKKYSGYNKINKIYKSIIMIFIIGVLTTFSSSTIYYLFNDQNILKMFNKNYVVNTNIMKYNIEMAKQMRNIVKDIDFVLPYEVYYYVGLQINDKKNFPSYVDLFKYEDCKKITEYLKKNDVTLCTNEFIYSILVKKYPEEIESLIKEKYRIIKLENNYILFVNQQNWSNIQQLKEIKLQ